VQDSVSELVDRLRAKAPAYLDLLTAKTDEEFEAAFTTLLETVVRQLEKNGKNYVGLGETGLSAVLASALTMPGLTVTQEAHSNGHVDLTIEADHCTPARVKLGEAKIYATPSYHIKGVTQLLGRYTTGRELTGLLINYVRRPGIKGITTTLMAAIDKEKPERLVAPCEPHKLKWSFSTKHEHLSGETLTVDHIGCNLGYGDEKT
jgi:hypothetical protein